MDESLSDPLDVYGLDDRVIVKAMVVVVIVFGCGESVTVTVIAGIDTIKHLLSIQDNRKIDEIAPPALNYPHLLYQKLLIIKT